ncbi:uncharacterized protein LOC116050645 isoform X3 [Sander lucioperca]|uniref:uncharacterized protein LOC116050645 isoform X3 n=1 Tax=Sander lucioperca TaxID=283035 RepID=UPI00125CFBD8|nr:uncharacterized protein LOC116050645 isoform X3 [Sander lucioperca]
MGSPSSPTQDEVHCLRPLCSHTCSWEAEQRLRKCKPGKVKALTSSRASATASEGHSFLSLLSEDRFPAFTAVNASEWLDAGSPIEASLLGREDDFSEAAPHTLISCVALPSGAKERTKSPQLAVKEVIFLPPAEMDKSVVSKKKLKQDKSRKRALLKQTFVKSPLNQEGKGSLKSEGDTDLSDPGFPRTGSDSDHQVKKASAPSQVPRLVPVGQTLAAAPEAKDDQQPPRSAQTLLLRNKPMVFEPLWERIQRKHTQEEHHTSKYKLDQKTGIDGIDCWETLKRQTCLWRRHAQLVMSECGRPSSSEDKADYVPYRLHPIPIPSSHYQSKSSSKTGNCRSLSVVWGAN